MFSDNILKLINNSIYYNHTLNLTNAFLTLPLTSSCTVILFNVQTTPICCKNLLLLIIIIFDEFKKNDNNKKKKKKKKKEKQSLTHTHLYYVFYKYAQDDNARDLVLAGFKIDTI